MTRYSGWCKDRRGRAVIRFDRKECAPLFERKTTITSAGQGYMTTGVMPIDRIPGIVPEARQELTVRDALTANSDDASRCRFRESLQPMTIGSPAPEARRKLKISFRSSVGERKSSNDCELDSGVEANISMTSRN